MGITEDQFRKALGLFSTGVTVITVPAHFGENVGITISSFTSVSLHPPQVLFCLSKHSRMQPIFAESSYFAVNILKATQSLLSDGFAQRLPLHWDSVKTHGHPETECLLLSDALGHVVCEKGTVYEGGDHDIIVGKVIDIMVNYHELPLVRHKGQYLTTRFI